MNLQPLPPRWRGAAVLILSASTTVAGQGLLEDINQQPAANPDSTPAASPASPPQRRPRAVPDRRHGQGHYPDQRRRTRHRQLVAAALLIGASSAITALGAGCEQTGAR